MTYVSYVDALPGAHSRWNFVGGYTNSGPTGTQALTQNGDAATGATAVVSEFATSMSASNGMAYYDAANGNALHPSTDGQFMGLVAIDSLPTGGGYKQLFGLQSAMWVGVTSAGQVAALMDTASPPSGYVNTVSLPLGAVTAGSVHHFAIGWSKTSGAYPGSCVFFLDGEYAGMLVRDFNLPTSTLRLSVGFNETGRGSYRFNCVTYGTTQLDRGQVKGAVAQVSAIVPPTYGSQHEPTNPGATLAPGLDGGHLRSDGKNRVTLSGGRAWPTAQYIYAQRNNPQALITTGNWATAIYPTVAWNLYDFYLGVCQRAGYGGTDNQTYIDSNGQLYQPQAGAVNVVREAGTGAAILHHWLTKTKKARGSSDATLVRWASTWITRAIATQDPDDGTFNSDPDNQDFDCYAYPRLLLFLSPYVDPSTYADWCAAIERGCERDYQYLKSFYIQGNRDWQQAVGFLYLYKATGKRIWYSRSEEKAKNTWLPLTSQACGSGLGNANASGFGIHQYSTGFCTSNVGDARIAYTAIDPVTSKVYFAEGKNRNISSDPIGTDWDYAQNQAGMTWAAYICLRDIERDGGAPATATITSTHLFNLFSAQCNLAADRQTFSGTWTYDYTGGTRHTGSGPRGETPWEILKLAKNPTTGASLRSDFTTDMSGHWPVSVAQEVQGYRGGPGYNVYRHVSDQWAGILMTDLNFRCPSPMGV